MVQVQDVLMADELHLDIVYNKYERTVHSLAGNLWSYFFGIRQYGIQTTEEMLKEGTVVSGKFYYLYSLLWYKVESQSGICLPVASDELKPSLVTARGYSREVEGVICSLPCWWQHLTWAEFTQIVRAAPHRYACSVQALLTLWKLKFLKFYYYPYCAFYSSCKSSSCNQKQ